MTEFVYVSIVVVEMHADKTITIESISVTEDECVLSGAWEFNLSEKSEVKNVIDGRLVIVLGSESEFTDYIEDSNLVYLSAEPFLIEAKKAAADALVAYETFKSENPTKRKKLVAPDFFEWPDSVDFNNSTKIMEGMGKMATPHNTPDKMRKTLAASRLIKLLIDMWHSDEQERKNRKYVEGDDAAITALPLSWLNKSKVHRRSATA